ncbi:MAG: hypothetical protein HC896_08180 [Bacteroidales bacterium]|nr:hypothetical protein [Bacteroidales bacterium]
MHFLLKGCHNLRAHSPLFPYSSDDGFSVIDFKQVSPELGDWNDVARLKLSFDLMMDLVINHVSSKSLWFNQFLNQQGEGKDFFIEVDPAQDLSQVTRPRSSPLLAAYQTKAGENMYGQPLVPIRLILTLPTLQFCWPW